MPKLIPDAKQRILAAARQQLFQDGYAGLALRRLAGRCGVAVGTIYNYFPGKEMLVAGIMAEDWLAALAGMERRCAAAPNVEAGVGAIYEEICAFVQLYRPIWAEYQGMPGGFGRRHVMLRGQLAQLLCGLLARLGRGRDAPLCPLLAETVLACAMQQDIGYDVLAQTVRRLFP